MAEQTVTELEAELASLRAARVELLTTGGIKEVWREGRRITYNVTSMPDLNKAILDTEARLAAASSKCAAKGRFRALRPSF